MEQDTWDNLTDSAAKAGEEGNAEGAGNYFTFSLIYNDKDKEKPELEVISFTGNENLSFVYDFYVTLRSQTDNIPALLGEVLLRPAVLCIVVEKHFAYYHGIVTEFRQIKRVGDYTQYELRLRAKMFLPYLNTRSDIYVGKKFSDIIDGVMKDNDFNSLDYELKLTGSHYDPLPAGYNRWSYVCQYEESDLNFLQRLMEREGVYYYYVQDQTWHESLQDVKPEKMIITDSKVSHSPAKKTLQYKQAGAPGPGPAPETIFTMIMHQAAFPAQVTLRNYNYDKANMGTMSATADVGQAAGGSGRVQTIYGENFSTAEEGEALAKIRAEEIFCQTKVYYGMASGPGLTPGTLIKIKDSGDIFSGDYLIIHADHTGKQPLTGIEEEFEYNNTFTMIPATVQYRPQRLTPKPKIHATMNAVVDGSMSWETPEIDKDVGRYKVRLPFAPDDSSNDVNAKWGKSTDKYHVRMAGPFAGTSEKTHGMNFPLHKGAEVVLSFRDGDPDLPVISGAVYNSQNFNVVTEKNPKQHVIKTPGGNQIVMDDTPGGEYIYLYSPYGKEKGSWMYVGHGAEEEGLSHIKNSGAKHELTLGQEDSFVIGSENWVTIGSKLEALLGTSSEFTMAMKSVFEWAGTIECKAGHHLEFGKTTERIKDKDDLLGTDSIKIAAGLPVIHKAVLSNLENVLNFGGAALGALVAAGAGDLGGLTNPKGDDADQAWKQAVTTTSAIAVGTAAQLAALIYLVKKLNTELTNAISTIDMDKTGIKMNVTVPGPDIHANGDQNDVSIGLGIKRGQSANPVETSSIKIAGNSENTDSITLTKSPDGGKITVNNAGTLIDKHTGNNLNTSINLATDNIIMEKDAGGKVTVNAAGVTLERAGNGKIVVEDNKVTTGLVNSFYLEISNQGVQMGLNKNMGNNVIQLTSAAVTVDTNGFIKLG